MKSVSVIDAWFAFIAQGGNTLHITGSPSTRNGRGDSLSHALTGLERTKADTNTSSDYIFLLAVKLLPPWRLWEMTKSSLDVSTVASLTSLPPPCYACKGYVQTLFVCPMMTLLATLFVDTKI